MANDGVSVKVPEWRRLWNKFARMLCLEQVREVLSIPAVYRRVVARYVQVPRAQSLESGRPVKSVYFDLRDNTFHRYLYCLIKFFDLAGMKVLIRKRVGFLGRISLFSEMIVDLPNVFLVTEKPISSQLVVCQSAKKVRNFRSVLLSDDYFSAGDDSSYHVPMCMHPNVYSAGTSWRRGMSRAEGRVRLFFAGNTDPSRYANQIISSLFQKLNRVEVVTAVRASFPQEAVSAWSPGEGGQMVLLDAPSAMVDSAGFMDMLGRSDFFLSPPGVMMPLCHNTIEAMFMGVIPILQHPELFHPPLEDNVNCIVFQDKEELIRRISEILAMPSGIIDELRHHVISYYDQHLAPEAVIQNIMGRGDKLRTIYLLSEQGSVEKLRRRKMREERSLM